MPGRKPASHKDHLLFILFNNNMIGDRWSSSFKKEASSVVFDPLPAYHPPGPYSPHEKFPALNFLYPFGRRSDAVSHR